MVDFLDDPVAVRDFGEWLLQMDLLDSAGSNDTKHYSRRGYATPPDAVVLGSNAVPSNVIAERRIARAPVVKQSLWSRGGIGGRSYPQVSSAVLRNTDGGLDALAPSQGHRWRGRPVRAWFFDNRDIEGTAVKVLEMLLDEPKFSTEQVEVTFRSKESVFDQPMSRRRYRGTGYMLEDAGAGGDATYIGYSKSLIGTDKEITGDLTFETWVWPISLGGAISHGWLAGNTSPFLIQILTNGRVRIQGQVGGGTQAITSTVALAATTGKPYHLSVIVSSGDVTFILWDEDAQTEVVETYLSGSGGFTSATRDSAAVGTVFQTNRVNPSGTYWTEEIRLWNIARTTAQIRAARYGQFDDDEVPSSLVLYHKLNDGTGTTVVDSSASGDDGTLSGTGTFTWLPGIEGGSDIAGSPKPDLWGYIRSVNPILVSSTDEIYQVAGEESIQEIEDVYEGGNSVGSVSDQSNLRTFLVTTPSSSNVLTHLDRALFRIPATPSLPIRVRAKGYNGGTLGYVETVPDIFRDIITRRGPMLNESGTPPEVLTGNFSTLESSFPWPVALYLSGGEVMGDVLDTLASWVVSWWGYKRAAYGLGIEELKDPSLAGSADHALSDRIVSVRPKGSDTIVRRVVVRFRPGDPLTEEQLAGAVIGTKDWETWLKSFKEVVAHDPDVAAAYPGDASRELVLDTGIYRWVDAHELATKLLALFGEVRESYEIDVASTGLEISVGDVVTVDYTKQSGSTRLNLDGTKKFLVLSTEDRMQEGIVRLEVWG